MSFKTSRRSKIRMDLTDFLQVSCSTTTFLTRALTHPNRQPHKNYICKRVAVRTPYKPSEYITTGTYPSSTHSRTRNSQPSRTFSSLKPWLAASFILDPSPRDGSVVTQSSIPLADRNPGDPRLGIQRRPSACSLVK